jgi:hypothetical protein
LCKISGIILVISCNIEESGLTCCSGKLYMSLQVFTEILYKGIKYSCMWQAWELKQWDVICDLLNIYGILSLKYYNTAHPHMITLVSNMYTLDVILRYIVCNVQGNMLTFTLRSQLAARMGWQKVLGKMFAIGQIVKWYFLRNSTCINIFGPT